MRSKGVVTALCAFLRREMPSADLSVPAQLHAARVLRSSKHILMGEHEALWVSATAECARVHANPADFGSEYATVAADREHTLFMAWLHATTEVDLAESVVWRLLCHLRQDATWRDPELFVLTVPSTPQMIAFRALEAQQCASEALHASVLFELQKPPCAAVAQLRLAKQATQRRMRLQEAYATRARAVAFAEM
jgi:hypothetical protein